VLGASAAMAQMGSDALVLVEPWRAGSLVSRAEPCALIRDIQEPWEKIPIPAPLAAATGALEPVALDAPPRRFASDAAPLELLVTPDWAAPVADAMWVVADVPLVVEPWTEGSYDSVLALPPALDAEAPAPQSAAPSDPPAIPTAAFPPVD
jgi:hypothetical protein